jgi:hypothetical protein
MISLQVIFWLLVLIFAMIGAVRCWASELLVTFSSVLALFILFILDNFAGFAKEGALFTQPIPHFWLQTIILIVLAVLGYQAPNLPALAGHTRFASRAPMDHLAGAFLGALNGFFIFGSLWFFMDMAGYPFAIISAPVGGTEIGDAAINLLAYLPPNWMVSPAIYFSAGLALALVVVAFL